MYITEKALPAPKPKWYSYVFLVILFGLWSFIYDIGMFIGFVLACSVHGLGHVWAIKRLGLTVQRDRDSILLFLVFGEVCAKEQVRNAKDDAFLAAMGPIVSVLLLSIVGGLHIVTGDVMYVQMMFGITIINVYHLLPVFPFDGGRMLLAVSSEIWVILVVCIMTLGWTVLYPDLSILVLIVVFCVIPSYYFSSGNGGYRRIPERIRIYKEHMEPFDAYVQHRAMSFADAGTKLLTRRHELLEKTLLQKEERLEKQVIDNIYESFYEGEKTEEQRQRGYEKLQERIKELEEMDAHKKVYYITPVKTKMTYFLLYWLLVVIFVWSAAYAVMEIDRHLIEEFQRMLNNI